MWERGNSVRVGSSARGEGVGDMEGTQMMLQLARDHRLIAGHLRGLFHIAIGRTLTATDGTILSMGMSWRDLSQLLKAMKFDREHVRELGADPDLL